MYGYKWNKNKNTTKSKKQFHSTEEKKKGVRKPVIRPHETEEEAMIRRFHDAQRMARFRARKKKALEEAKGCHTIGCSEHSATSEIMKENTVSASANTLPNIERSLPYWSVQSSLIAQQSCGQSKYVQLLGIIERLGKDIRLTYAGSRASIERLKVGIIQARMLIKECLLETEINSRKC